MSIPNSKNLRCRIPPLPISLKTVARTRGQPTSKLLTRYAVCLWPWVPSRDDATAVDWPPYVRISSAIQRRKIVFGSCVAWPPLDSDVHIVICWTTMDGYDRCLLPKALTSWRALKPQNNGWMFRVPAIGKTTSWWVSLTQESTKANGHSQNSRLSLNIVGKMRE